MVIQRYMEGDQMVIALTSNTGSTMKRVHDKK